MFEAGKRYWAKNGEYSVKVTCVKRTKFRATFTANESDTRRYFGLPAKFTKEITPIDVPDRNGMRRECIIRLSDEHPGCDWCVTDGKVGSK